LKKDIRFYKFEKEKRKETELFRIDKKCEKIKLRKNDGVGGSGSGLGLGLAP